LKNFKNKKIYGWSRSDFSSCFYIQTSDIGKISDIFDFAKNDNKKVSFRSGGRSYGDNTLNKENIVINYKSEKNIFSFDENKGEIVVSGSCTIKNLLNYTIPRGWMLHVSPASQYISIAGAVSNNVHGKNCVSKGYFGDYVDSFEIITPKKGIIKCTEKENSELFFSTISGLGAFGLIIKATLRLRKIKTILVDTQTQFVKNIDDAMYKTTQLIKNHEYNIGSLNFSRYNNKILSGNIYSSNFSEKINISNFNGNASFLIYFVNFLLLINNLPLCDKVIEFLLSKMTSGKKVDKKIVQNYYQMNFLGDKFLPLYNYFFRNGFIEYQVIFDKNDYLKAINEIEYLLQANNYSSYMSSFKAYKASNSKYLFGLEKNGFCITLDIPFEKGKKFQYFVRKLNEITIKYNGQVYLGKTPCINNEEFKTMYKNYPEFKKLKIYYDPNFLLVSEMTNRLFSDFYNHKC
jgi:FAD/FMN-containing dehydrogenase|tara:strand:- start:909 stop:2291 length:1383 start_codon:yes stop_codon:yes gene_type:complete